MIVNAANMKYITSVLKCRYIGYLLQLASELGHLSHFVADLHILPTKEII